MSQNDETHFKNLAAFAARFLKCIWPFWDIIHYRVKQTKTKEKIDFQRSSSIRSLFRKVIYIALCDFRPFRDALSLLFEMIRSMMQFLLIMFFMISLRNMALKTIWIQKDNASNQYKSKHSFGLHHQLADEFGLRTILTYAAVDHSKGAIGGRILLGKTFLLVICFLIVVKPWLVTFRKGMPNSVTLIY